MTNLAGRPSSVRGDRRREQLVEAGLALLGEYGWPGVTARAVAERAGTNPGLIHYHFGGLPGLHAAIFRRGTDLLVNPLVDELMSARDERAALAALRALLPQTTGDESAPRLGGGDESASRRTAHDESASRLGGGDESASRRTAHDEPASRLGGGGESVARLVAGDEFGSRLAAELIIGATRDPALGAMLRDELRQARQQIAERLCGLHPDWSARQAIGVATLVVAAIDGLMLHCMIDGAVPAEEALDVAERLLPGEAV